MLMKWHQFHQHFIYFIYYDSASRYTAQILKAQDIQESGNDIFTINS